MFDKQAVLSLYEKYQSLSVQAFEQEDLDFLNSISVFEIITLAHLPPSYYIYFDAIQDITTITAADRLIREVQTEDLLPETDEAHIYEVILQACLFCKCNQSNAVFEHLCLLLRAMPTSIQEGIFR